MCEGDWRPVCRAAGVDLRLLRVSAKELPHVIEDGRHVQNSK